MQKVNEFYFREQNDKQKEEENINYKIRKLDEEISIQKIKREEVKAAFFSLNPRPDQKKRVEASYEKQKQKINDNIQKLERRKQKLGMYLLTPIGQCPFWKFFYFGQNVHFGHEWPMGVKKVKRGLPSNQIVYFFC